ncbi:unnamed protein product [Cladocopium goreaui]|uniref:Uncharacterized protein n=1 Tax=Cladocopium goreaui TaxID=2562237 RepID=A0A9P1CGT5_9DINO|nr:unnamed protein product [Cladocopium goreaui]
MWTDITLQCFPDCPSWPMRQRTVMDSGGGLRVGSLLRLACDGRPEVAIRCGMRGTWELLREREDGPGGSPPGRPSRPSGRSLKFTVGPELSEQEFASMCPLSNGSRQNLMNMTFWAKLSGDERAMFLILALGCFGSLCGLACTYFLSPYVPDEPPEEEQNDSETQNEASEDPALRRFNLLTGELERRRSLGRRKRGGSTRLSAMVQRSASRLAGYLQDGGPKVASCSNCDRPASHVCFPCSHLCLCVTCAEDFLHSFPGGFQELHRDEAKPAQVFDVPGPLDLALSAASAAASSLRRGAAYAAQGAADVAARSRHIPPTTVGRSRESRESRETRV